MLTPGKVYKHKIQYKFGLQFNPDGCLIPTPDVTPQISEQSLNHMDFEQNFNAEINLI